VEIVSRTTASKKKTTEQRALEERRAAEDTSQDQNCERPRNDGLNIAADAGPKRRRGSRKQNKPHPFLRYQNPNASVTYIFIAKMHQYISIAKIMISVKMRSRVKMHSSLKNLHPKFFSRNAFSKTKIDFSSSIRTPHGVYFVDLGQRFQMFFL
jgi:hypothetical protein